MLFTLTHKNYQKKTVFNNKHQPKPIKLFEVSDVVLRDGSVDVGARNERRLCALYCGLTTGFEHLQGLLDRIMQVLDVLRPEEKEARAKAAAAAIKAGHKAMPVHNATYRCELLADPANVPSDARWTFDAHGARVLVKQHDSKEETLVGYIGMVHPEVLNSFEVGYPCSALELNIEHFI